MNLFSHCMVCGQAQDSTSANRLGFHVHGRCMDKTTHLDMAIFQSATVITHKDHTLDDRWFCVSGEHAPDYFTIRVYDSTEDYLAQNVARIVDRAFYASAIAYVVAQFNEKG